MLQHTCISKFYGCVNLRVIFQNTCRVKSFFPYKDRLSPSQRSKIVLTVTSDDVCCNIRNVKYKMKMFVTAVCFLFLLKLKWPKDKSIYET